jgi:acetyl-CoA synthetase
VSDAISDLLKEDRTFPPSDEVKARALVTDASIYDEANTDREGFWARQAAELDWFEDWDTILDWEAPYAKWFVGGKLNVAHNCVDRHVEAGHGDQVAYHWEGEPGDTRTITYADLLDEVQRAANALKALGVGKGDRVAVYLPMIPELPITMLACARIGAVHSVVFGGFSAAALRDRINDSECKVLVTADGGHRRGSVAPLKPAADEALADTPSIEKVLVVRGARTTSRWTDGRDVWWHDARRRAAGRRLPRRADGQRGPALPALHLGHHGQAQGHHAHHRWATSPRWPTRTGTCSTSSPTRTSTGAPPTSAG